MLLPIFMYFVICYMYVFLVFKHVPDNTDIPRISLAGLTCSLLHKKGAGYSAG